ncbi:monocarboxylate transporter 14 [Plakobranchus ocellatus]|uniref:Monocarboxylate transporter 14 n=1 Tax=Plakobranchus ocellatus TaxID=259542 RepID=A0AAV4AR24_9GAST|nr:monocarboxylate transporter 14 [Plakobranchus ocellatus]
MEGGVWGLVIIVAAFMIQFLAFGTTATIGVYNIELLEYFPGSTIGVSLIASLNFGIFLGSGPIVSFLMTKFSYRQIAITGSALVVIGLLGMPLLPYIPAMCFCFGVMAGFGSCCAYIPSHVLSGLYYDKNRSLATGVATSGSGLGGAVMPIVAGLLIEAYSWKGSFVIIAGLCLHMFIFSALLRMPEQKGAKEAAVKDTESSVALSKTIDDKSLENEIASPAENTKAQNLDLNTDGVCAESKPLISGASESASPLHLRLCSSGENVGDSTQSKTLEGQVKKQESDSLRPKVCSKLQAASETSISQNKDAKMVISGVEAEMNGNGTPISLSKELVKNPIFRPFGGLNGKTETASLEDISSRSRSRTLCLTSETELEKKYLSPNTHDHVKPAHKTHLPHGWQISTSLTSLHTVGTTRGSCYLVFDRNDDLPTSPQEHAAVLSDKETEEAGKRIDIEIDEGKKPKRPKSARHIYIFTLYGFNIYFISNILWNAGCSIVTSFAPEYLRSQGLTSMEAAFLLGTFGFGCFVGGVFGGLLGNAAWIHRQTLYIMANVIMGVALTVFPFMGSRNLYLTCLLVSGLSFGIILGLLIVVLTDLIGVESLSNGLGYLMLSNGIGTFIGPPLAGIMKEATGGFESGIILAGVFCIVGGLVMLLMPCKDLVTKLFTACCLCRRKQEKDIGSIAMVSGTEDASC